VKTATPSGTARCKNFEPRPSDRMYVRDYQRRARRALKAIARESGVRGLSLKTAALDEFLRSRKGRLTISFSVGLNKQAGFAAGPTSIVDYSSELMAAFGKQLIEGSKRLQRYVKKEKLPVGRCFRKEPLRLRGVR
jgi:hypothetical protein